ncbi:MAG TPA: HAMP domain-containing sensor histidine kinase [Mycobacteriales bacterium]|nr:HAMP domain-containing sensor histidine kinase [Mycobacteriales bacterium]
MRRSRPLLRWAWRPQLPRRTVRLRLTATYAVLFTVCGAVLLTITYLLVGRTTAVQVNSNGNHTLVIVGGSVVGSVPVPGTPRAIGSTIQAGPGDPQQFQSQADQLLDAALHQQRVERRQLQIASAIALAVMAALSAGTGWVVSGRVLRRLHLVTATAQQISVTNLNRRLALPGPDDELKELGDTFDALLARLDASFQSQRRFIANASHELRTPLTRQRALIQVALADPAADASSLRDAHQRALDANVAQEHVIDALLLLARGQAGLRDRERVDLAVVARTTADAHLADAGARDLTITGSYQPAEVLGAPRLLERIATNLVDNAIRYNTSNGNVEICTATIDRHAVLTVANTGPVIAPDDIDRLFEPFTRGDRDRTHHPDGLGLGLSIVKAIAEAHHATVRAHAQPGGGLQIIVAIPGADPANPANA